MQWRFFNSTSPFYRLGFNDSPSVLRASQSSTNAKFKHGFCSIGAYNNGAQGNPSDASQYWGDISVILVYNTTLTDDQMLQNYNTFKARFPT
jgi:hypothetical protein